MIEASHNISYLQSSNNQLTTMQLVILWSDAFERQESKLARIGHLNYSHSCVVRYIDLESLLSHFC